MHFCSVMSRDWKTFAKIITGILTLLASVFILSLPVAAVLERKSAAVRASDGHVYEVHYTQPISIENFSIHGLDGDSPSREVAAELYMAAHILNSPPTASDIYQGDELVDWIHSETEHTALWKGYHRLATIVGSVSMSYLVGALTGTIEITESFIETEAVQGAVQALTTLTRFGGEEQVMSEAYTTAWVFAEMAVSGKQTFDNMLSSAENGKEVSIEEIKSAYNALLQADVYVKWVHWLMREYLILPDRWERLEDFLPSISPLTALGQFFASAGENIEDLRNVRTIFHERRIKIATEISVNVDIAFGETVKARIMSALASAGFYDREPPTIERSIEGIKIEYPDLRVDSMSIDKTTVAPGETFQINTRIWNAGKVTSPATTLRYYLSTGDTISADDTEVASSRVASLLPKGAHPSRRRADISETLTAPDTPGNYYYGVCVNVVAGDADISNNCSQAIAITVEAPPPDPSETPDPVSIPRPEEPDLFISAARVEKSTIPLGGGFRLYFTIENRGLRAAPATMLRYYRSLDATISPEEDTELYAVPVGQIGAGKRVTTWALLPSATSLGVFYYGVCVDGVASEFDTSNNCSEAFEITIEAQGTRTQRLIPSGTIPTQALDVEGSPIVLDVSSKFFGKVERYIASSSDTSVVTAVMSGSEVTLTLVGEGWATVTIEASSGDLAAKQDFFVSVGGVAVPEPPSPVTRVPKTDITSKPDPGISIGQDTDVTSDPLIDTSSAELVPDENLRRAIESRSGLAGDTLTPQRLQRLKWFEAINFGIIDLTGLEHATNLSTLNLSNNSISDISALSGLTKLVVLLLNDNSISDISALSGLTELTGLTLWNNSISDISALSGLTKLVTLFLDDNSISDISALSGLTELTGLYLSDNSISNVTPLENLTNLSHLSLSGNPIDDLAPLRRLKEQNPSVSIDIDINADLNNAPTLPSTPVLPEETALLSNYPNPFNPETWIPYQLAKVADVTVTIYDLRGVVVRRLSLGHRPAGFYYSRGRAAHWDGRNALGEKVASGLYFYTFTAGDFTAIQKLLIRK